MNLQAVAFDAYGTLCFIAEKTNPLLDLLKQLDMAALDAKRLLMTRDLHLPELVHGLARSRPMDLVAIEQKVQREVDSVQLFADVDETLSRLKGSGLKLAVVSNLASPYAAPLYRLLGDRIDHFVWSFEVGAIKPEAAIFEELCRRLDCPPGNVLMVGDSLPADVMGARRFGMQAIHLNRGRKSRVEQNIASLTELLV